MSIKSNITHLAVYNIHKEGVFNNVNSYHEMIKNIIKYGKADEDNYNNRVGDAFEIFTQFFCIKYGDTPLIGIRNILDTSDDPFNEGFDFTYVDYSGNPGQIQSKFRSDPTYQFTIGDLATNGEMARNLGIDFDNNILFINFDDSDNLFHYKFQSARNARRVIGRNVQEEYILRDSKFWDEFRKCIKKSSINEFENPYTPRDIQDWILNGKGLYDGVNKVLDGTYSKGRIEASTGAGKTLCQYYNIHDSFVKHNKNLAVMILPTRSLINQTFKEFYKWKMFGYEENGNIVDTGVSCLIIMSGSNVRYNNQVANVLQTLGSKNSSEFIKREISMGRKVVVFTTMKSHELKYSDIVSELKEANIRVGLEIVDEYHNIINNSTDRKSQLDVAEYLRDNSWRCDGSLFYSASNKDGNILSSFNEDLFGPLLARVNRNDLRLRGYVCPKLIFKIIKVNPVNNTMEVKRDSIRMKVDLDKAQMEAVGVVTAYNDLRQYYENPNMITFGDHVEGCRYISKSPLMKEYLPDVENHFMAAETTNSERDSIIEHIKHSGSNILHQHSVAKEGINLPNLSGGVIGRDMNIISLQQAIGRSDRALYSDTKKLQSGEININSKKGWEKYYNLMYLIVDEDTIFADRVKKIVRYLLDEGIPESEWDISVVEDDGRNKVDGNITEYEPSVLHEVSFNKKKFDKMIQEVKLEVLEEGKKVKEEVSKLIEKEKLNSIKREDWLKMNFG